ncbi:MAG: alpha/beta hydrolase [Chitinophagaceae bacterium]|nr:MAG: alpha/beta hydrolase [Chitinophagaceae bacterium]
MPPTQRLINNKQLSYQSIGSGLPLVLLHGFGEDSRIWSEQRVLSDEARLIIPDLPGTAASEAPAAYTMEEMAASIKSLLDAEGIERCILVGHSMGGYIALAFAEQWPERLIGLGLFHSSALADTAAKVETRRKGIEFIQKNGAAAFLKTSIPGLYAKKTTEDRPELIEKHLAEATQTAPEALVGYYEAMIARPDRTQLLKDAQIPILLILGREDIAVSLADGLAQSHLPAICHLELMEETGHMGMREHPETANEHLRSYVRFINQRTAAE